MPSHELIYLSLLIIFTGLITLRFLIQRNRRNPFIENSPLPYQRQNIMSQTELAVYDLLLQALPNYMIFPQVQASRILNVPKSRDSYYWLNFISRLSYDFVICRQDGTPIATIEIDDKSHNNSKRIATDLRKNRATEAARIVMLRWPVKQIPTIREIEKLIHKIDKNTI